MRICLIYESDQFIRIVTELENTVDLMSIFVKHSRYMHHRFHAKFALLNMRKTSQKAQKYDGRNVKTCELKTKIESQYSYRVHLLLFGICRKSKTNNFT